MSYPCYPVAYMDEIAAGAVLVSGPLATLYASGKLGSLTFDQKRFLASLIEHGTPSAASKDTRVTVAQHYAWVRSNSVYAEAANAVGDSLLMEASARIASLTNKAAQTFEEALDAEKVLKVECPACKHDFELLVTDLKFRTSIAEKVLKANILAPRLKVEGELKHRDLGLEDRIALQQLSRGEQLPPNILQDLQRRGLITEAMIRSNAHTIDGESRLLPEAH